MRTAGVDFASKDEKTAVCVIEWSNRRASVEELIVGVSDEVIADRASQVKKLGIDVPLGWPIAFVEAVGEYASKGTWPSDYRHAKNESYRLRLTDRVVRQEVGGITPLSVSADRIAIPAMRAAALMASLARPSARDGSGVVVEVYPAAALQRWGMSSRQYKTARHVDRRHELVGQLLDQVPWLSLTNDAADLVRGNDDAFDALVASLIARAAAKNLVDPLEKAQRKWARREGWIVLPLADSLSRLPGK